MITIVSTEQFHSTFEMYYFEHQLIIIIIQHSNLYLHEVTLFFMVSREVFSINVNHIMENIVARVKRTKIT